MSFPKKSGFGGGASSLLTQLGGGFAPSAPTFKAPDLRAGSGKVQSPKQHASVEKAGKASAAKRKARAMDRI